MFPEMLAREVTHRLSFEHSDRLPEEGYPIDSIVKHARIVLGSPGSTTSHAQPSTAAPDAMAVKMEQMLNSFTSVLRRLDDRLTRAPSYSNNAGPDNRGNRMTQWTNECGFCGKADHFIRRCGTVYRYKQEKKITRTNGKIAYLDGTVVFAPPGMTIQQAVDEWIKAHPQKEGPGPTLAMNMFEIPAPREAFIGARLEEVPDQDDDEVTTLSKQLSSATVKDEVIRLCAQLQQAKERKNRHQVFDGVELPTMRPPGQKPEPPKARSTDNRPNDNRTNDNRPAVYEPRPRTEDRQFKFVSPVDDPAVVKNVLDKSLEQSVLITQRQLLALSPDARKYLHNLTGVKKVAATGTAALLEEADEHPVEQYLDIESSRVVHHPACPHGRPYEDSSTADFLSLRTIDVLIDGTAKVDCILDSGSQFIAMHRSVWEQTNLSLQQDRGTIVESANNTRSRTLGLIEGAAFTLGGLTIYVNVQVVEDAPFLVLLGRPFFAFLACVTKDFPDGNQHIEIRDPKTGNRVTLPTRERRRESTAPPQPSGF